MNLRALLLLTIFMAPGTDTAPDGWRTAAPRAEIAPRAWVERTESENSSTYQLGLAGQGHEALDGRWLRTVPVRAGQFYAFRAEYQAQKVEYPTRSILARVLWFDRQGRQLGQAEYPRTQSKPAPDGWTVLADTYRAPESAARAQLELHLRWTPHGQVLWRNAVLSATKAPPPRWVRLAAVNHRPRNSASPQRNLEQFGRLIDEAARRKADVVCLPEGITVVGTGKQYAARCGPHDLEWGSRRLNLQAEVE